MGHDLYEKGRALMKGGAFKQAAGAFAQSVAADPHFKSLELLGECYVKLGRAPALLAEVFEKLGQHQDAIEMAQLAIERSSTNKRAREVLERLGPIDTTEP